MISVSIVCNDRVNRVEAKLQAKSTVSKEERQRAQFHESVEGT